MKLSEEEARELEQEHIESLDFYEEQIEVLEGELSDCEEELSGMYYKTLLFPALKDRIDELNIEIEDWEEKLEEEREEFRALELPESMGSLS